MRRPTSPASFLRHATWVSVVLFVLFEAAAARLYPGGTWFDRGSAGYSHRFNFFCDLTASSALNGASNPAAPLARVAMLALSLGTIAFWWTLAALSPRGRARTLVCVLGTSSGTLASAVAFLPSREVGAVHAIVTTTALVLGLFAGALAIRGAFRRGALLVCVLGALAFSMGALVSALYVASQTLHTEASDVPAAQKLAAAVLLAWMVATATRAAERAGPSQAKEPQRRPDR